MTFLNKNLFIIGFVFLAWVVSTAAGATVIDNSSTTDLNAESTTSPGVANGPMDNASVNSSSGSNTTVDTKNNLKKNANSAVDTSSVPAGN